MAIVSQSLKDFGLVGLEGLSKEEFIIKLNEGYNDLRNKKQVHPKVKIYENKANLFLTSKRYSKAYKMLSKAKKYRKIDYKTLIDEAYML